MHPCGSYSLSDFEHIERLKPDVQQVLSRYAPRFSFLVCRLNQSQKYHPPVYAHPTFPDSEPTQTFSFPE